MVNKRIRKWLSSTNNKIPKAISNIQGQNIENHTTKIQNCLQKIKIFNKKGTMNFQVHLKTELWVRIHIVYSKNVWINRHDRLHIKNYVNSWIHENYLPVIFCHFMFHKIILIWLWPGLPSCEDVVFSHSHTHGISIVSRLCLWPLQLSAK